MYPPETRKNGWEEQNHVKDYRLYCAYEPTFTN